MRVLFLHPNFDAPLGVSIGISYVAGTLRRAGHEVHALHVSELLGYPFDLERILADVRAVDPGLVGISSGYNHYPEMRRVIDAVEGQLGIPVLLGGIHTTLNTEHVMAENPRLSFANCGEGEESTLELVEALESGRDPADIRNLWVRTPSGIRANATRPFMDLAHLADMATDIWDFQGVIDQRRGWVNVSAQRGCPYRCPYCHNNGVAQVMSKRMGVPSSSNSALGFLRYRPAEAMVRELCAIRDRWDMQAFSFIDDTFTMNPEWVRGFLELYAREVRVPFVCNTTAIDLDAALLDALVAAGCRIVRMGVESGSSRIVNDVLKRRFIGEERLRWAFRAAQERGLNALAFLMIGNIGETRDEMLQTFRLNADLRPTSMKLSLAHPYPGTDYETMAVRQESVDPGKRVHNFIEESVLSRSDSDRLWLDKVRTFYFWYVNRYLENEGAPRFERLIDELEALPPERWRDAEVRRALWQRHEEESAELRARGVWHYTTPFAERTDIVVSATFVAEERELIRRELTEPH
jgi:radical SAM superfamily enzyme YgiQ (UPF0313 family)